MFKLTDNFCDENKYVKYQNACEIGQDKAGFIIFVEKISNKTYISMSVRSAIPRIFTNCVTTHYSVQTYVISQAIVKMGCTVMDNYGT